MDSIVIGVVAITVLLFIVPLYILKPVDQTWTVTGNKWNLPPGPSGVPVIGNLWQYFRARKAGQIDSYLSSLRTYGEMTTLHMGSRTWVMLNSNRVAADIIVKHGKITTERPYMPIASGLVSNNKRTVIRQTAQWIEGRRVMHHLLSGSVLQTYGNWQEIESLQLLVSYLERPKYWYAHHYRYAMAALYRLVMGDELSKSKAELDDYQQVTIEFILSLNRSLVDFFPRLDKLPRIFQFWRAHWTKVGQFHRRVFQDWWDPVQAAVENGTASSSFVRDTLLHPETKYTGTGEEAMYLATSVMAAGSDNTRMTLNTFIMAMISYPGALQRAQAEVDGICGTGSTVRLPTIADMDSLPYLCAMVKEVLRWRPTVPTVPSHQLTETLEYDGYRFPAGTEFLINNVAISQSFDHANVFKPERWINGHEGNVVHDFWGFGGGRRICVGYRVAQQALFVAFARIVYAFDIAPDGDFDDRYLNHGSLSEPFPVEVSIRSFEHWRLIRLSNEKLKLVS